MTIDKAVAATINDFVTAHADAMAGMLAELVKEPSDNPPGDCAPHAKRAADLLEQRGSTVESHPVPAALVTANGLNYSNNIVGRKTYGDGQNRREPRMKKGFHYG